MGWPTISNAARAWLGVARSLRVYRLDRGHAASLSAFYGALVAPGALAFDVGAHVGDRTAALRALGARVVAVEPQARLARTLRALHGRDPGVRVVRAAVGAAPGRARLATNAANPTVATLSPALVAAAPGAAAWAGQVWDGAEVAPMTTLDALVAAHGAPDFVKLDVEGHEAAALAGLSAAPPLLSFEVVALLPDAGLAALRRAGALGYRAFRLSLGESHRWAGPWVGAAAMADRLGRFPEAANSGDVYCRL